MRYKINKLERGTWPDGKPKMKVSVIDLNGKSSENVTISKTKQDGTEFPNYDNLDVGMEIEAEEYVNPKGYMSLYPPRIKNAVTGKFTPNKGNIQAVMKQKQESIEHSQDRKDLGIRLSSTARMATDITVEQLKIDSNLDWQTKWLENRKWFIDNWEKIDGVLNSDGSEMPNF